ncbi:MAG: YbaN family protein [Gemmatimonadota bacterium]|jgi:uncharacterized membrane protein YbaN (DUF454 family)|nr:YbaN family protein [Gemmatimonadota bacterium]
MTSPAAQLPVAPANALAPAMPKAWRIALLIIGWTSLGLGVLGMFVPLLPTTCFLLGAAWCFGKTSPTLHRWMLTNRLFGRYLRDYKAGLGFPAAVKVTSLVIMWGTMLVTVIVMPRVWIGGLLFVVGAAVTWHLVTLPTSRTT